VCSHIAHNAMSAVTTTVCGNFLPYKAMRTSEEDLFALAQVLMSYMPAADLTSRT